MVDHQYICQASVAQRSRWARTRRRCCTRRCAAWCCLIPMASMSTALLAAVWCMRHTMQHTTQHTCKHECSIHAAHMHHTCTTHAPYMQHECSIHAPYMHHTCTKRNVHHTRIATPEIISPRHTILATMLRNSFATPFVFHFLVPSLGSA